MKNLTNMCIYASESERESLSAVPACEKLDKHAYLCI